MIIEITIATEVLIVKDTKLKSSALENRAKELSEKTVQKDKERENGKMKSHRECLQKV